MNAPARPRVLLVDDEADVRDFVAEGIALLGYEPVLAESGREALGALDAGVCRIVISDWMMPEMDGLELTRRIRAIKGAPYTWVILLTALFGRDRYLEGMRAGADDFVTKPCALDELHARLRVAERVLNLHDDVKLLRGLISICMYCKDVDVAEESWTAVEHYVEERSAAEFSHGICPRCYRECVQPQIDALGDRGA